MPLKVVPEIKAYVEKMRKAEAAYKKTKEYKLWLEKLEYSKNNV